MGVGRWETDCFFWSWPWAESDASDMSGVGRTWVDVGVARMHFSPVCSEHARVPRQSKRRLKPGNPVFSVVHHHVQNRPHRL